MKSQRGKRASLVMTVDSSLIWANYANFTHTHITRLKGNLIPCLVHNKYLDSDSLMVETCFSNSDFVSVCFSSLHVSFIFCMVPVTSGTKFGCVPRTHSCFLAFMPFLKQFLTASRSGQMLKKSYNERKNWESRSLRMKR